MHSKFSLQKEGNHDPWCGNTPADADRGFLQCCQCRRACRSRASGGWGVRDQALWSAKKRVDHLRVCKDLLSWRVNCSRSSLQPPESCIARHAGVFWRPLWLLLSRGIRRIIPEAMSAKTLVSTWVIGRTRGKAQVLSHRGAGIAPGILLARCTCDAGHPPLTPTPSANHPMPIAVKSLYA